MRYGVVCGFTQSMSSFKTGDFFLTGKQRTPFRRAELAKGS